MFHFIRRLRRQMLDSGQFRKYLKYAGGEILLVVVGILLALQINNWNNRKSDQAKIRQYSKSLIQDLEEDILMIRKRRLQTIQIMNRIDSLANYVYGKDIGEISNIDLLFLSSKILYMPFSWNRTTLEQMKNSGSMQFIQDLDLVKMIGEYDAFTYHMDEDYINDKSKSDQAIDLMNRVTDNNYPNMEAMRKQIFININNVVYDEFHAFTEEEYFRAKNYDLPLRTDNIKELQEAVNALVRLQVHFSIRTDVELPQLEQNAIDLIDRLIQTYLD